MLPSTLYTLLKPRTAKRPVMPRLEMPWWQMNASVVSFGSARRGFRNPHSRAHVPVSASPGLCDVDRAEMGDQRFM
jgi:hypothetical protein